MYYETQRGNYLRVLTFVFLSDFLAQLKGAKRYYDAQNNEKK